MSATTERLQRSTIERFCSSAATLFAVDLSIDPGSGARSRPLTLSSATSERIAMCHAVCPPLAVANQAIGRPGLPAYYFVYFSDQAHWVSSCGGEFRRVNPYELSILRTSDAWAFRFARPYSITSLAIGQARFEDAVLQYKGLIGQPLGLSRPLDTAAVGLLSHAASKLHSSDIGFVITTVTRSLLGALALADRSPRSHDDAGLAGRYRQARAYIDRHYADADLTVGRVARALGVSPRYLQRAFSANEASLAGYLWNRRLQAGADLLRDPQSGARSVTSVAIACGFSSSSHFTSKFKQAFGTLPTTYRAETGRAQAEG